MKITRKSSRPPDDPDTPVTLKTMGNILEIRQCARTMAPPIQKLDRDHGLDLRTGEVIEYHHRETRSQDKASVAQSLKRLRDIINANLTDPSTALWVTLTYAENMTDPKRLYQDYEKFWKRFLYRLKQDGHPKAEYIAAAEPQGRGAWHLHCLFLFPDKAPFIPNEKIAELWRQGFTFTKHPKGDNVGLYLTAYLGDMELEEALKTGNDIGRIVEVEAEDPHGKRMKKAIAKGARLYLYPAGFNLYRCSRGVKRPTIIKTTEGEAQAIVGDAPMVYEKTIDLTDDDDILINTIYYRQYNKARKPKTDSNT